MLGRKNACLSSTVYLSVKGTVPNELCIVGALCCLPQCFTLLSSSFSTARAFSLLAGFSLQCFITISSPGGALLPARTAPTSGFHSCLRGATCSNVTVFWKTACSSRGIPGVFKQRWCFSYIPVGTWIIEVLCIGRTSHSSECISVTNVDGLAIFEAQTKQFPNSNAMQGYARYAKNSLKRLSQRQIFIFEKIPASHERIPPDHLIINPNR